ncbi:hypothetical protein [Actinotalea sp. Marseille-Q4924]|uniref:hypothetical protein n=1 Tax=Actinotalea sp. Marseille-Q4924 TaxID=2866571 RepID=UPI001CE47FA5|nr:hypothetical protein [Actinotalea sp. Marseille-Q4924]
MSTALAVGLAARGGAADGARTDTGVTADGAADRSLPAPAVGLLGLGRVGAGLVAVASGAEHLRHAGGAAWGVTLVTLGVVVGVRGLLGVRRRRTPGPREAALLGGAGAAWAAVATSGAMPGGVPHVADGADAALVALLLGSAAVAAAGVRSGRPASRGRPVLRLAGWAGGAVVVAAITAGGLASTEAGRHAVPHGDHGLQTRPPVSDVPASGHPGH